MSSRQTWAIQQDPVSKNNKKLPLMSGGVAKAEHLPSKHKALSSNPNITERIVKSIIELKRRESSSLPDKMIWEDQT
jgi:hypothetical protein